MPKPIRTLEDVQGQASAVYVTLSHAIVPHNPNAAIATLAECVRTLATICMQQRDELAVLRKVLAQDKPAVMRNMETK